MLCLATITTKWIEISGVKNSLSIFSWKWAGKLTHFTTTHFSTVFWLISERLRHWTFYKSSTALYCTLLLPRVQHYTIHFILPWKQHCTILHCTVSCPEQQYTIKYTFPALTAALHFTLHLSCYTSSIIRKLFYTKNNQF